MADNAVRGRFVWHELMTPDPKAGAAFYKDVVGWAPQTYDKDPNYTLLTMGGRPMAGSMALPEAAKAMGAPPHWITYIGTPNVDATARQAIELGGKVLRPASDIPDIGRFAIIQDPQGAVFAAFTPKGGPPPGANDKPGLGDFSWHELVTTDWPAAYTFYQKLFGWDKTDSMEMGPGNTYQMFGGEGKTVGGMFNKPASMPGPPFWLPYALIRDSKGAAETIKKLGGKVINGPIEVPGGDWITQGIDPQGVMFAVHSKKPAAAAKPAKKATVKSAAKKSAPAKRKSKSKTATVKSAAKKKAKSAGKRAKKGARRR